MLLLADRLFPGWELWGLAAAAGADLLWRLKKNQVLPPCRVLPDGSFWSVMPTPAESARQGQARARGRVLARPPEGHLVRVIEYDITIADAAGGTRTEPFRLVTTLLDHERAPAAQLAALYHQRWEARPASPTSRPGSAARHSPSAPAPRTSSARKYSPSSPSTRR